MMECKCEDLRLYFALFDQSEYGHAGKTWEQGGYDCVYGLCSKPSLPAHLCISKFFCLPKCATVISHSFPGFPHVLVCFLIAVVFVVVIIKFIVTPVNKARMHVVIAIAVPIEDSMLTAESDNMNLYTC